MADHPVPDGTLGVNDVALTANVVDTVDFGAHRQWIEVQTDGTAAVYFTVDGTVPAVGGADAYEIPAGASGESRRRVQNPQPEKAIVVRLVSAATPKYSVYGEAS